jgi:hypothetical protein
MTSELVDQLAPITFSLQPIKLSTSFRFLDVWFNL